jgi:hypothetical protein
MLTNIWAIKRDVKIRYLLLQLTGTLGHNAFQISSSADGHYESIELSSNVDGNVRAYVYTFGQPTDRYGIILDYPVLDDNYVSPTEMSRENLDFTALVNLLAAHFDVTNYNHCTPDRG